MEAEIFEPLDLHYDDLLLLSSSPPPPPPPLCSSEDAERLGALSRRVMEALGPGGPGLLCISGVPRAPALRRALLPLARKLALLRATDRARILKIHGLGTDVPMKNLDRRVSSFATQLKYPVDQMSARDSAGEHENISIVKENIRTDQHDSSREGENVHSVKENISMDQHDSPCEDEFKMLGCCFRQLGLSMMDIGLHVARTCDRAIGSQDLERSIIDSRSAKGRLIHYHSACDNVMLKDIMKKTKGTVNKKAGSNMQTLHVSRKSEDGLVAQPENKVRDIKTPLVRPEDVRLTSNMTCQKPSLTNLWQQWHYDYGIFTILTAPMFLSSHERLSKAGSVSVPDNQECCSPDNHTYLQLCVPTRNKILLVKTSSESFIVQIGEAADILSRGKLRSTLHSVGRSNTLDNISRETYVVFLQPTWDKILPMPEYLSHETCRDESLEQQRNGAYTPLLDNGDQLHDSEWLKQEVLRNVPPLASRLRDGMTFAEFSRETTRQYYGGSGIQPNK